MIPAIICGGQGTRLWPVSRATFPKPFCNLLDETLLTKTIKRLRPIGEPWLITAENLRGLTLRLFRELGLDQKRVLFEPVPRNTAPAIALLCHVLQSQKCGKDVVGIFPADHLVQNESEFLNALRLAEQTAQAGQVCTIGIKPTYPATGFGYIEVSSQVLKEESGLKSFRTVGFREKPDEKTAKEFLSKKSFFWNGGVFVFKVDVMAEAFSKHMPQLWSGVQKIYPDLSNIGDIYKNLESKSIDYGVMEKLESQACVPCDLGWSDVGSWDEVSKIESSKDSKQVFGERKDNWVFSSNQKKVVGLVDVDGLLIVDTDDALLVSKKGSSQKVGALVKELDQKSPQITKEHPFDFRPWGAFENIREDKGYKVKVIRVDPGQQFSYQSHNQRSEHWVIVKGEAIVVLEDKDHHLKTGDYIFIPKGAKHRMRNEGKVAVEFVEVQAGPYLGEDDIIRYSDDYGRAK